VAGRGLGSGACRQAEVPCHHRGRVRHRGSVLEGISAIVLFASLLFPLAKAMGVHEVHYARGIILAARHYGYPRILLESLVFAATPVAFQTTLVARLRK
jgi:hypothetical protein